MYAWLCTLFFASTCLASFADELLISALLDPEFCAHPEESISSFMTTKKTNDEYDEIFERLPFLYMTYICNSNPKKVPTIMFTECATKKENTELPFLKEFVERIPQSFIVKFVFVPPGPLRQAMVDRGCFTLSQILELCFASGFLPPQPFIGTLKQDIDQLVHANFNRELEELNRIIRPYVNIYKGDKFIHPKLISTVALFGKVVQRWDLMQSVLLAMSELSKQTSVDNSLSLAVCDFYQNSHSRPSDSNLTSMDTSFWCNLPNEVKYIIFQRCPLIMRLVNKEASQSTAIPDSPSNPLKFLTMMRSNKQSWIELTYSRVRQFPYLSESDVETVNSFLSRLSHDEHVADCISHNNASSDSWYLLRQSKLEDVKPIEPRVVCDAVIACILSSLIFEQGAFGPHLDPALKNQLAVVAKTLFPKQMIELMKARTVFELKRGTICDLFKNSQVPWYWTFACFADLSGNTKSSIFKLLSDEQCREFLITQLRDIEKLDRLVVRMVHQKLLEIRSVSDLESIFGSTDVFKFFDSRPQDLLSLSDRIVVYMHESKIRVQNIDAFPAIMGPVASKCLTECLICSFDSLLDKNVRLGFQAVFFKVLKTTGIAFIPFEEIADICEAQNDQDLETFARALLSCRESLKSLMASVFEKKEPIFPKLLVHIFNTGRDFSELEQFIICRLETATPVQLIKDFMERLTDELRQRIHECFEKRFPVISVILSRRQNRKIYQNKPVLIRLERVEPKIIHHIVIPSDASVLELYCRLSNRNLNVWKSFVLVFEGKVLMPNDQEVAPFANKKIYVVVYDKEMTNKVKAFLGID